MLPMPEIDILICTANRDSSSLSKSLESIQKSTFKDIRVLVVNDSSEPLVIEQSFGNLGVKVINIGRNVGLTAALKAAEPYLVADFVARMDCGDTMHPQRLEMQRDFFLRHPRCVLLGTASELLIHSDGLTRRLGTSLSSRDIPDISHFLRWRNPFVHGSVMFRRADFDSVGGYDVRYRIAQDFNLYMRMRKRGDLYILPDLLYTHIFHFKNSKTVRRNKASLASSLKSRLLLMSPFELFSPMFIAGLLRDCMLLIVPSRVLVWVRFSRKM